MTGAFATLPYALPFIGLGMWIMLRVYRWIDSRPTRK